MLLFVYGILRHPMIRQKVLGREAETRPAVLHGYVKVCGYDYLTLIRGEGSVPGVVFEVRPDEMSSIDEWEGFPTYQAFPVEVEVEGRKVRAHSYIMPTPPNFYEQVDDDCISAYPIENIIKQFETMSVKH